MPTITPTPAPGSYMNAQSVSFAFSADITGVAFTKDAAPPSISKYIAYDTLVPPNPFLAVTEDGKGRVVYEGGFPKFYNAANPAGPVNFAALTPAGKFLFNALNWVANPAKVALGNKKVLILGDGISTEAYPVKSLAPSGFYNALVYICSVAGFTPTFVDISDYGGVNLNPTLAQLEQYACILLMSSMHVDVARITAQAVNDLVTYRENGNGLIVITDHGYVLNSIADVTAVGSGFFKTANAVISRFGAYFTGDFGRTPVNVGFLRANYGDHPLYAGMLNAEDINAGGSESKVVVTTAATVAPGVVPPIVVSNTGLNIVNLLATLADGSVITTRIVYNIQGQEFVFMKSVNRNTSVEETNAGIAWADLAGKVSVNLNVDGSTLGTVWGEILLRGKRVGEVYYSGGVSNVYWYAGSAAATPIRHSDIVQLAVGVPFNYSKNLTVNRVEPVKANKNLSLDSLVKDGRPAYGTTGMSNIMRKMYNTVSPYLPIGLRKQKLSVAGNVAFLRDFTQNQLQITTALTAGIYSTTVAALAAVAAAPANPGTVIIDAVTNTVYAYKNGMIQAIAGLKMQDFFGAPRVITSSVNGATYRLELNGNITAL